MLSVADELERFTALQDRARRARARANQALARSNAKFSEVKEQLRAIDKMLRSALPKKKPTPFVWTKPANPNSVIDNLSTAEAVTLTVKLLKQYVESEKSEPKQEKRCKLTEERRVTAA
jgi:hypothetical protein